MVAVIVSSRHCNINPDNVATPIAASLGDLTTLALLSWIASLLFEAISMLVSHTLFHYNRILIIEMKKICTELIFKLGFLEFRVF